MKVKGVLTRLKGTFKSHMLARAYLSYKIGMVPVDQLFCNKCQNHLLKIHKVARLNVTALIRSSVYQGLIKEIAPFCDSP